MMKILKTKKQNELLKRVCACQIMVNNIENIDIKIYSKLIEHFAEISYEIGGIKGFDKVKKTVFRNWR